MSTASLDHGSHDGRPSTLDTHLVNAGQGDAVAFAALYEAFSARVYGLAARVLRDVHQAEEVTQEVFLQIWETSGRFDPARGSARAWVLTLAHRRAVDRVRRCEATRRRDDADAELSRSTPYDVTSATAHASLEAQSVRAALTALSPPQREALELAYFGGHTHSEVSRLLQIPHGTAKTRIRQGLLHLRDLLTTPASATA
jgi:RNA polymerase sigma-70 factor (ECF subfamily)